MNYTLSELFEFLPSPCFCRVGLFKFSPNNKYKNGYYEAFYDLNNDKEITTTAETPEKALIELLKKIQPKFESLKKLKFK
jgi:hypothetical protein